MPARHIRLLLAAAALLAGSAAAQASWEGATDAFTQKDFARVRQELDAKTLASEPQARIMLGVLARDGLGGPKDLSEAYVDISLGLMAASTEDVWQLAYTMRRPAAAQMTMAEILAAEQRVAAEARRGLSDAELKTRLDGIHAALAACKSDCDKPAEQAFRLGPAARQLAPDLEALMTRDPKWMPRLLYAAALAAIGTEGVPALGRILTDQKQLAAEGPWNLNAAASTLGLMGATAAAARPALLQALTATTDTSKADSNDLARELTGQPAEVIVFDAKIEVAMAIARVRDPGRELYAGLAAARDNGKDRVTSLLAGMAMAMTYKEYDPLMAIVEETLEGTATAGQAFAIHILPALSEDTHTAPRAKALTPLLTKLAGSADPSVRQAARSTLDTQMQDARWGAADELRDKKSSSALGKINAVLAVTPWNSDALELRALAERDLGDVPGALADYRASIDAHGDAYSVQFILAAAGAIKEDEESGTADELTLKALETCLRNDDCFAKMRQYQLR